MVTSVMLPRVRINNALMPFKFNPISFIEHVLC